MAKHPNQKLYVDDHGTTRFVKNPLVEYILDNGGIDLNQLASQAHVQGWSEEDQAQFAQLIGYSTSGWGDLSYVTPRQAGRQDAKAHTLWLEWKASQDGDS